MRQWFLGAAVVLALFPGSASAEDDAWVVADEALARGDKAKALAAAKNLPRLVTYLEACRPRPAALDTLLAARKAIARRDYDGALALLDSIDTAPVDVVSVRALRERLNVLAPLGRAQESVAPLEKAAAMAHQLGWARLEGIALGGLGYCANVRGDYRAAVPLNAKAIALLEKTGPLERLATACGNQGIAYRALGQWDRAIDAFGRARDVRQKMGDLFQAGSLTLAIGSTCADKGDDDAALRHYERALTIGRGQKDRVLIAAALVNSGNVYARRHQDDKALALALAGHAEAKAAGHRQFAVNALLLAGTVYLRLRRNEDARDVSLAALRLHPEDAGALANLGEAFRNMERFLDAEQVLVRAVAAADKSGSVNERLNARGALALTYCRLSRFDDARDAFEKNLALARRHGERHAEGDALSGLGAVHAHLGEPGKSRAYFEQALQVARGSPRSIAMYRLNFALALLDLGRTDEAIEQQAHAVKILTGRRAVSARADLAILYSRVKRYDEALAQAEKALVDARRLEDRQQEVICLVTLGGIHDDMGHPDRAVAHVRDAVRIEVAPRDAGRVARCLLQNGEFCRQDDPASAALLLSRAVELTKVLKDTRLHVEALALSARVQDAQGDLDGALATANEARRLADEANDESALAVSLVHLGWIRLSRREPDEAEAALRHGAALFRERRDAAGEGAAESYLSSVEHLRGNLKEATRHLERALELRQASGDRDAAFAHKGLGHLCAGLGRHAEAVEHYRRTLDVREDAETLALAANSLAQLRRFDEALAYGKRAQARLNGHESTRTLQIVRENIAEMHLARGEFRAAEALFREHLRNARERKDPHGEAVALRKIAWILRVRGELPRAIEILEGLQDSRGPYHARNLIALGLAYGAIGDVERALPLFTAALAEGERTGNADDITHSLNGIANCEARRGNVAASVAAHRRILEATDDAKERCYALSNLGSLARDGGRYREALDYFTQADALRPRAWTKCAIGNTLGSLGRHADARRFLEAAVEQSRDLRTLTALAFSYLPDEPQKAVPLLDEAIARVEQQRNRARGLSTRQQALYFRELRTSDPYQFMMDAQRLLGQNARALEYAERGRGRGALDLLERSRIDPLVEAERRARTRSDETTLARIAKLRTDLDRADDEVARLTQIEDADGVAAARRTRDTLLEQRARIVRRLLPVGAPISAAALQGLLRKDERLLYYVVARKGVQIFVVPPPGGAVEMHVTWLEEPALEKLVGRERVHAARTRGVGVPAATRPDPRLFRQIVPPPVWKAIRGAKRVYVLPDGPLHRLPFEMLPVDDAGTPWLDAGPPISYALSGSMLAWCRQRRDAHEDVDLPHEIVALGDARFPEGLAPLPGTRREAQAVGGLLLLGDDATKEALFDAAGKTRILHLATHQIADERDTYGYSRLALTGGFLHLYELFDKWRDRLSACQLVVLSACETVKGPMQRDEAPYAMPLGFLYAGAPAVIGSLWRVDDASTAELFADFYKRLAKGTPKLEAFTAARQALKKKYPAPYHWAAFVYIGDPR